MFTSTQLNNLFELIWRISLLFFISIMPFTVGWSLFLWLKLKRRDNLIAKINTDKIEYWAEPHWSWVLPKSVFEFLQLNKLISNLWNYNSIRIFTTANTLFIIKGLVKPKIREIPRENIVNITIELSAIFGSKCGTIYINHGDKTKLSSIKNPIRLKEVLQVNKFKESSKSMIATTMD